MTEVLSISRVELVGFQKNMKNLDNMGNNPVSIVVQLAMIWKVKFKCINVIMLCIGNIFSSFYTKDESISR